MLDWLYATSSSRWTSVEVALSWLKMIFLLETKSDEGQHWTLVLDGYGSHVDVEFISSMQE